jgi:regulator of PEP synthase PpsR (kinase-PPPase family)
MEFAVKHDDGLAGEGLGEAEIVLIGLSMFLGYLGYKTANVPLVRGIEPPQALFRIERAKIVGLTIDPERLSRIRGRRLRAIGARGRDGYADLNKIYEELEEAAAVQRRLACPVIDVTNLAVEEAAHRVIGLVEERGTAA